MSEPNVIQLAAALVREDSPAGAPGGGGAPTALDLSRIRAYALEECDPESLYVRRVTLCSDGLDRAYGQIPLPYLERLRDTLPGKSLLLNHSKWNTEVAVGLWFYAEIRPSGANEPGSHVLEAHFYIERSSAPEGLIGRIDAGIVRHTSISFTYDVEICNVCELSYWSCPHRRGQLLEDGRRATFRFGGDRELYEMVEGSLVYLGRQFGSTIRAGQGAGEDMDEKAVLGAIASLGTDLKNAIAVLGASRGPAGPPAPAAEPAPVDQALVEDGKAYRAELAGGICKNAGLLKCEKQAELALKGAATAAELKELAAEYEALVEERFPNSPVGTPEGEVEHGGAERESAPEAGRQARLF